MPECQHEWIMQEAGDKTEYICNECGAREDASSPRSGVAQSCAARTAGKLEALEEKFELHANRCQEQERYEAMDVWRDAAVDVRKIREQIK